MMNDHGTLDENAYHLDRLESLESPCLVVYQELVEENLAILQQEIEELLPGEAPGCLRPHVKTHKSSWATRLQLERGIDKFKCSPNELDMLIEEGARNIFVAYPPLGPLADRIAAAVSQDAGLRILAQISRIEHAGFLADAAGRYDVDLDYLIDIDVGDHRTGLPPPEAGALLKAIQGDSRFSRLHCEGLHAYDGHNHSPSPQERKECGYESMESLVKVLGELEDAGNRMRRLVVGGTPGSLPCLEALATRDDIEADIEISPGTYIYWDTRYDELMPGRFRLAALILARVMDRPTPRRITLDLGHKRWGIDQGPVHLFSSPGLEVVKVSEEHTVLEHDGNSTLRIGDPVLIAPRHICATVNLWEEFHLVTANGQLQSEPLAVTARNR